MQATNTGDMLYQKDAAFHVNRNVYQFSYYGCRKIFRKTEPS